MIIRAADCPARPWKNGLGLTRELARSPHEAADEDWLWRCSVADVGSEAPFSRFPGIDRHIVLLHGAGFDMRLDDGQRQPLRAPLAPFAFAGEREVRISLLDGPTQDFNLMVRRSRGHGAISVLREPDRYQLPADAVLLYVASGRIETPHGDLLAGDAWRLDITPSDDLRLPPGATALLVSWQACD